MYSDWEEDWNERIIIISCDRASWIMKVNK
jgi:hypothetical protein